MPPPPADDAAAGVQGRKGANAFGKSLKLGSDMLLGGGDALSLSIRGHGGANALIVAAETHTANGASPAGTAFEQRLMVATAA